MTDNLSDKAIYFLDQVVQAVFQRHGLAQQYGPADRYGVIEWAANMTNLTPFEGRSLDLGGIAVDVAIAAWHPDDLREEFAAETQVTLGVRSQRFFTRWHFAPAKLPNLQDHAQCEHALSEAVEQVYSSKRTLSAIQSVLSPENAPSDMTVLPVLGSTVPHGTATSAP